MVVCICLVLSLIILMVGFCIDNDALSTRDDCIYICQNAHAHSPHLLALVRMLAYTHIQYIVHTYVQTQTHNPNTPRTEINTYMYVYIRVTIEAHTKHHFSYINSHHKPCPVQGLSSRFSAALLSRRPSSSVLTDLLGRKSYTHTYTYIHTF